MLNLAENIQNQDRFGYKIANGLDLTSPISTEVNRKDVFSHFFKHVVMLYVLPRSIVSYKDPLLLNNFLTELFCLQGMKLSHDLRGLLKEVIFLLQIFYKFQEFLVSVFCLC